MFKYLLVIMALCLSISGSTQNSNYSNTSVLDSDNDKSHLTQYIALNELKTITLGAGESVSYLFSFADSRYYTIETYGSSDTYLSMTLNGFTFTNDDSGDGSNARLSFVGINGQTAIFTVRLYNANSTGTFSMRIRKQQFVMFTNFYDAYHSTVTHSDTAESLFSSTYDTHVYFDYTSTSAASLGVTGFPLMDGDVLFFAGHGDGSTNRQGGAVVFGGSNFTYMYLNGSLNETPYLPTLNNVKVAFWDACYSAKTENQYGTSFVLQSVANGADASVGFRQSILLTSAKAFADTFFTSMSNGSNVSVAAQAGADCLIFTLDAAKDYAIAGNATVTINTSYSYPDNIVFSPQEIVSLQRELQNGYKAEQLRENVKRYYKLINGLISTSYYDVTFENDQIVSFISHLKNYTNILLPQDVYKQTSLPSQYIEDGIIYDSALANKKLYAYCKVGNFMVPVEIIYVSYISTNTGLATEAVICTNLNNGEILNYYDIAIEH